MSDFCFDTAAVTWHWLRRIGFRFAAASFDRTPHMLWLTRDRYETGLEISPSPGTKGQWMVWIRSDIAGNRSRFCFVRNVETLGQLMRMMEAMTDTSVTFEDFDADQFAQSLEAEKAECERRYAEFARNARRSATFGA